MLNRRELFSTLAAPLVLPVMWMMPKPEPETVLMYDLNGSLIGARHRFAGEAWSVRADYPGFIATSTKPADSHV